MCGVQGGLSVWFAKGRYLTGEIDWGTCTVPDGAAVGSTDIDRYGNSDFTSPGLALHCKCMIPAFASSQSGRWLFMEVGGRLRGTAVTHSPASGRFLPVPSQAPLSLLG